MKAIETRRKGYRFRSRLEARWSVFFDQMGIDWLYEHEGYEKDGFCYLPDFYLPDLGVHVEVKGDLAGGMRKLFDSDFQWFLDFSCPMPGFSESFGTDKGLLILGPIPEPANGSVPLFTMIQHHEGLQFSPAWFDDNGAVYVASGNSELFCLPEDSENLSEIIVGHAGRRLRQDGGAVNRALQSARSARFEHGECA